MLTVFVRIMDKMKAIILYNETINLPKPVK